MTMADRIVVMSMGEVQQIGTPKELYTNPKNKFVAQFLGLPPMNMKEVLYEDGHIEFFGTRFALTEADQKLLNEKGYNGKKIILGVRSQAFHDEGIYVNAYGDTKITINPINVEYLGDSTSIFFYDEDKNMMCATVGPHSDVKADVAYDLVIEKTKLHFFDFDTEESIKFE